jgi:cytochrome c553
MRVLKWLGYIVGGLVILILIAVGTVYAVTSNRMGRTYPTQVENIPIPTDSASLARGTHLVRAVGKCAECHGADFAGKVVEDEPVFISMTSSNLTSGKGGIGSAYTDADWVRAIRYGVGREGKPLIFMPSEAFTSFSDADLGAMIAYLKTLPPADMTITPRKTIGPIARMVYLAGKFPLIPAEMIDRSQSREHIPPAVTKEYGKYLVETGGCASCHLPTLEGQKAGDMVTANLTPGGPLGKWTEADFFTAIRTGTRPDGTKISEQMPWKAMATLTDDELRSMWLYITSVAPVAPKKK